MLCNVGLIVAVEPSVSASIPRSLKYLYICICIFDCLYFYVYVCVYLPIYLCIYNIYIYIYNIYVCIYTARYLHIFISIYYL